MLIAAGLQSCKEESKAEEATISLKVKATDASSVTFEITTENAVSYSYAIAESSKIADAEYVTEDAENGKPVEITRNGLESETEYAIKAFASNSDGKKSIEVSEKATTTTAASIEIEPVSATPNSISFKLLPVNAVSYSYTVAGPDQDAETAELDKDVESSEAGEFTVDGLEENTGYTIIAAAANAAGEESERAYLTVQTDIEPSIEILSILPESDQAKVTANILDAVQFAWAYSEKGAAVPERDSFAKTTMTSTENSFIISGLEQNTDYFVHIYGITKKGYEGEILSTGFTTEEYIEKPFEITVSGISSTDADITVFLDKETYSSYYFVAGSQTWIKDITDYDFKSQHGGWSAVKPEIYEESMELRLSQFKPSVQLDLESVYYIGGVPVTEDGTIDETATVWRQIQLSPVVFGEGSSELSIEDVSASIDKVTFALNAGSRENIECIYLGVSKSGTDIGQSAKDALKSPSKAVRDLSFLDRDTTFSYLSPATDYVIFAVAKDKDGKIGEIASMPVSTNSVFDQGDATCGISEPAAGTNDMSFEITLDPGTEKVMYKYIEKDSWQDEETFLKMLKVNNASSVSSDGELAIKGLDAETDYVFGFCAVGEDGTLGKHYIVEASTEPYVFDGNTDAKVSISINSVKPAVQDHPEYGYYVKIQAEPSQQVSEYYIQISDSSTESYLTQTDFVTNCINGSQQKYTAPAELTGFDGNGEICAPNATIWVLAIDTEGKLVPVAETKIEDTWI